MPDNVTDLEARRMVQEAVSRAENAVTRVVAHEDRCEERWDLQRQQVAAMAESMRALSLSVDAGRKEVTAKMDRVIAELHSRIDSETKRLHKRVSLANERHDERMWSVTKIVIGALVSAILVLGGILFRWLVFGAPNV